MPRIKYEPAEDVCKAIELILSTGMFPHIKPGRVKCVKSKGSKSRAIARIYGLPKPWIVVGLEPGYVIEVVSERFFKLSCKEKVKTLIHELLHIPATFSGGLRPHGKIVNGRRVNAYYRRLDSSLLEELCRVLSEG